MLEVACNLGSNPSWLIGANAPDIRNKILSLFLNLRLFCFRKVVASTFLFVGP